MRGAVFGRIGTSEERQREPPAATCSPSQPREAGCLCGIDFGAVEVKIVVCDARGARLGSSHARCRGHPVSALCEAIAQLPETLRAGPVHLAVTGSGQYLLHTVSTCTLANDVLAIALG